MRIIEVRSGTPDGRMYGLVRDAQGRPKIEGDAASLHPGIVMMMTAAEREALGLWAGPVARDAQGVKRLELAGEEYTAKDALVAVSEIWTEGGCLQVLQRADVPAGGTFTVKEA